MAFLCRLVHHQHHVPRRGDDHRRIVQYRPVLHALDLRLDIALWKRKIVPQLSHVCVCV